MSELIERLGVDVVLERYYNFAGEGVRAAHRHGIPSILEVNSPVVDHPGSIKAFMDRYVVFHFMEGLRERQCELAAALVTPLPAIVPASVPRSKVHRIHWGANVESFRPGIAPLGPAAELPIPDGARVIVFSSSFRHWHGAEFLIDAAARVLQDPQARCAFFLFGGAGPSLARAKNRAHHLDIESRVAFTGAVPYEQMPHYLARAHVGVAPYQPALHGQLRLGFYWSPLKIFEYMAAGLPVVAPAIARIPALVEHEREGLLYEHAPDMKVGPTAGRPRARPDAAPGALAASLERLADPDLRGRLGREARSRAVREYSWKAHCAALERGMIDALARRA